jgi:hypothetical protein
VNKVAVRQQELAKIWRTSRDISLPDFAFAKGYLPSDYQAVRSPLDRKNGIEHWAVMLSTVS